MNNDASTTPLGTRRDTDRDEHSLQTYLSDMLALEQHIGQPLARQTQFDDASSYGSAVAIITRIKTVSDAHVGSLESRLDTLGGDAASGIKSAWASLLGMGAAAIDSMRKTRISKSLRDDYTALSLATIGYTMLDATALALNDAPTAALARRHLADYAPIVMQIGLEMPQIVLQELRATGVRVDASVADAARKDAESAWRPGASTN